MLALASLLTAQLFLGQPKVKPTPKDVLAGVAKVAVLYSVVWVATKWRSRDR